MFLTLDRSTRERETGSSLCCQWGELEGVPSLIQMLPHPLQNPGCCISYMSAVYLAVWSIFLLFSSGEAQSSQSPGASKSSWSQSGDGAAGVSVVLPPVGLPLNNILVHDKIRFSLQVRQTTKGDNESSSPSESSQKASQGKNNSSPAFLQVSFWL